MKRKKKKLSDSVEELDAMGQESETKAAKWVIEKGRQEEKETQEEKAIAQEILTQARKYKEDYKQKLLSYAFDMIHTVELPKNYNIGAFYTSKGLVIWVLTPGHKWFARGMQVSGEAKYDLNGVDRLLIAACDQIDQFVDEDNKSKGGIYIK